MQVPNIRFHRHSSRFFIQVAGKRLYLGRGHDPANPPAEVRKKYAEAVGRIARGVRPRADVGIPDPMVVVPLSVAELVQRYLAWAEARYKRSQQAEVLAWALRPLVLAYGAMPAKEFGPRLLQEFQKTLAKRGLTRQGIISATSYVRSMIRWAVGQEELDVACFEALRHAPPLKEGQIDAPEKQEKNMVPIEDLERTLPELSPTIRAMVEVQLLTGMRPAEVCGLNLSEIDRRDKTCWVYRPYLHKTRHHGRERMIPLTPSAIAILVPFLRADGKPLFSPAEARASWEVEKRATRKSKVQPSQLDRHKADPQVEPGERYDTGSYRRAISRACERAGVPAWSPNQIRKLVAQRVSDLVGIDKARALLGHSNSDVTLHSYAKSELAQATSAARVLESQNHA